MDAKFNTKLFILINLALLLKHLGTAPLSSKSCVQYAHACQEITRRLAQRVLISKGAIRLPIRPNGRLSNSSGKW